MRNACAGDYGDSAGLATAGVKEKEKSKNNIRNKTNNPILNSQKTRVEDGAPSTFTRTIPRTRARLSPRSM
jgi:hypothetical protein